MRGEIHSRDVDKMLRSRLWHGLRQELKNCSGHKFDTYPTFDNLLTELRITEQDHRDRISQLNPTKRSTTAKMYDLSTRTEFSW